MSKRKSVEASDEAPLFCPIRFPSHSNSMSKRKSVAEAPPRKLPKKTRDGKAMKFGDVLQEDSNRPPAQHFTRSRGKKCDFCGDMCDHWSEECPIVKIDTVKFEMPQPHCLTCGEGCGHWSGQCPHNPKPVRRFNQENVVVVVYLPREDGDKDLYELFREFNPTRWCIYPEYKPSSFELTGFGSGAGQVSFQTDEDAQKATEKFHGHVYKGRALDVQWTTVKGTPRLGG